MSATALKSVTKSFSINLPAATTVGKKSFPFDLPSDYKTVRGFYICRNLGTDYLKVTVKDSNGVNVLDPVNIAHLNGTLAQNTSSLEIDKKFFKKTPFEANGRKMSLEIDVFTIVGTAQDFDFVYECDQDELEVPHNH